MGFTPCKADQPQQGMELQKKKQKRNKVYSISLCSWIPDSGCERKETIETDILVTSRNGDIKLCNLSE